MANETTLTLVGNLTADPELRFTPAGAALCKFTVASTPRAYDKGTGEWKDGEALFMNCSAWREMAENIAESLVKGSRVVVTGRLKLNRWKTPEGENRQAFQLDVEEVGPSLRYATAQVNKLTRTGGGAPAAPSGEANPWETNGGDEPPF
ncbi:single-stranded DNA-binding protein [Catellatospora paridis]|uniref:single-stranded DNA-binding protein n=1 Tax=Catellatospora paridis TaxID=1617086 RepID=UPI0012D47AB0|nr:single-stranded DNA-binding protein [Catellatospora paridis]